jgi:hypothetical protein
MPKVVSCTTGGTSGGQSRLYTAKASAAGFGVEAALCSAGAA